MNPEPDEREPDDPKDLPLSFKAPRSFEKRLKAAAKATRLSKSAVALAAVEAVLAAIERDKGLVVPVGFKLSLEVLRRPSLVYQQPEDAAHKTAAEDADPVGPGEAGRQELLNRAALADVPPPSRTTPVPRK